MIVVAHRDTAPAAQGYRRRRLRRQGIVIGMLALLCVSIACDVATGPAGIGLERLFQILVNPEAVSRMQAAIVWNVRLPQALMAVLVGMALALAGAQMQTVLDNPLASPFTLGISAAASFGAGLAIVLGLGIPGVPSQYLVTVNAFVFALASMGLLYLLARGRGFGSESLVLFGIALVFTFNALVALMQLVASQDTLQQLVFWSLGSLARSTWGKVGALALLLVVLTPLIQRQAWALTALTLGDERARSFGVRVERLRVWTMVRISLLAAVSVSFVGVIGFVGLVAPHIARLLVGEDHRMMLPASALAGGVILSIASVVSKNLIDGVLIPVGIVTSLVGIPFFVAIVARSRETA